MFKVLISYFFMIIVCGILIVNTWAIEIDDIKDRNLNEKIAHLVAADAAWKANDKEFREMREINQSFESEIREFSEYVASLKRQVFVGCEAVRVLGGDASEEGVDCIEIKDDPAIQQGEALSNIKREATREEQTEKLVSEIKQLESEFDGMIMDQQAMIKEDARMNQSYGGWSGSRGNEEAEGKFGSRTNRAELGAGSGGKRGGNLPEFGSEDIGDPRDDDIVARQLREAAESEIDPFLKEQLWNEYKDYKKSKR